MFHSDVYLIGSYYLDVLLVSLFGKRTLQERSHGDRVRQWPVQPLSGGAR